jgi:hypothetical protein
VDSNERLPVLEAFEAIAPMAAEDLARHITGFLPLPVHATALHRHTVVVLGPRGAGKSALFRVLLESGGDIGRLFSGIVEPNAQWMDSWSMGPGHPMPAELDALAAAVDDEGLRLFWMVHLLQRVSAEAPDWTWSAPARLGPGIFEGGLATTAVVEAARQSVSDLARGLDEAERVFEANNRVVLAAYDQIDLLGGHDLRKRTRLAASLLGLWQTLSLRYRRLRGKIFLRPDVFLDASRSSVDVSKLVDRSADLEWSREDIFRLVARRLANVPESEAPAHVSQLARSWLDRHARVPLMPLRGLGFMPGPIGAEDQKSFAHALAGDYMGSGPSKGATHRWLWSHLQDGNGSVVPRSMLSLLRFAARHALAKPLESGENLLRPADLVGALRETSLQRVTEVEQDFKLVRRLQNLEEMLVPMRRDELAPLLARPTRGEEEDLPRDGEWVLDELLRLGVLTRRKDGRLDVPDIYRYGYGIKRKGGAAATE